MWWKEQQACKPQNWEWVITVTAELKNTAESYNELSVPLCDCNKKKKKSLIGAKTEGWHPAVEDITIKIDSKRRLENGERKIC